MPKAKFWRSNEMLLLEAGACSWKLDGLVWRNEGLYGHLDSLEGIAYEDAETAIQKAVNKEIDSFFKAEALAKKAHAGQLDKGGNDYFTSHVDKVAGMVPPEEGLPTIALLHDVLEDTDVTEQELREQFPDSIVDVVVCLTKREEETYDEYIDRVAKNEKAATVKICDLLNNMDLTRLQEVTEKDKKRVLKYAKAAARLANR